MAEAVVGFGSSLGNRAGYMSLAASALALSPGVTGCRGSRIYASAPWGGAATQVFLNAAVVFETTLQPVDLLKLCKSIEMRMGRKAGVRWADRVLDLDVLWMEGVVLEEPGLCVPHPRLRQRMFALRPLLELVPNAKDAEGSPYRSSLVAGGGLSVTGVLACGLRPAYPRA